MTKQEIGHLYRALLFRDGTLTISETLSDEASFNLYEELERFGFDYYIERYQNAEEEKAIGLTDKMDKLEDLFQNRAKVLLRMSGKDDAFIESNYESFAEKLKFFYLAKRNERIHEQLKDSSIDFDSIVKAFDDSQFLKDSEEDEVTIEISTPEDFINFIEGSSEMYDDILKRYDFSEEERATVQANKKKKIDELKEQFMTFLSNYYDDCFKVVFDGDFDDNLKQQYRAEIRKVIDICREYLGDEETAKYLEDRYNSAIGMNDLIKDELKVSEDSSVVLGDELDGELDTLDDHGSIEKQNGILEENNVADEDDVKIDDEVTSSVSHDGEVASDSLDDYSQMSNDEIFDVLNGLIENIKQATLENADNLADLIVEGNKLQSELDSRIAKLTGLSVEADLSKEEVKIRQSRHFTSDDKERMIAELYAGEDDNKKARHMR